MTGATLAAVVLAVGLVLVLTEPRRIDWSRRRPTGRPMTR